MKAKNYKVFLKALGFAMLAIIGIVVLSVGWGLLFRIHDNPELLEGK